ncbi:amidohydrolase [Facklamia sp. DSM 111018]|uniref:Amidohydrolase n=1 Tax=Facklamia lactis TaxID=2749967 RepID=A0ABS0LT02_9LACT|nr:M20 family metallopeptidase [Facklamia lactis]MBG9987281.1 amidohydrolase [Facklamia lactis]
MSFYERAKELQEETVANRRHLHQYPELGYDQVETSAYIRSKLEEYGYDPETFEAPIENSVVVNIGKPGKTIMLRADIDALPIQEDTGLEFSSKIDGKMHACGHDIHTAQLLTVARMLKEREDELEGTVKLLFQPAEELLNGAETLVKAGVLENPKVDFALASHVWPIAPKGIGFMKDHSMSGALNFKITLIGKSTHGAMPSRGVDPVYAATFIFNGLQSILAREVDFTSGGSITFGKFDGNGAMNLIPDKAVLEGTARSFTNETLKYMKERIPEIAELLAKAFRCEMEIEWIADVPVLFNDPELVERVRKVAEETVGDAYEIFDFPQQNGSEDFAFFSKEVPSVYFISAHKDSDLYQYNVHNSKVVMNEEMMAPTAAIFAQTAVDYLKGNL